MMLFTVSILYVYLFSYPHHTRVHVPKPSQHARTSVCIRGETPPLFIESCLTVLPYQLLLLKHFF